MLLYQSGSKFVSIYDGLGTGKGVVHGAQRWEKKHISK